jgi:hypothetical protein
MKPADYDLRARACWMYANWIETRNPLLSAANAVASKQKDIVKILSTDQHRLVERLHEMANADAKKATAFYNGLREIL